MQNKKLENMDQVFRNAMESLPEEKPGAGEWTAMKQRIASEGLLKDTVRIRPLFLVLAAATLAGVSVFYFLATPDSQEKLPSTSGQVPAVSSVLKDRRQADASASVQDIQVSVADVAHAAKKKQTAVTVVHQSVTSASPAQTKPGKIVPSDVSNTPARPKSTMTAAEAMIPPKAGSELTSLVQDIPVLPKEKAVRGQEDQQKSTPASIASITEEVGISGERQHEALVITNGEKEQTSVPIPVSEALPDKTVAPLALQQVNLVQDTIRKSDSLRSISEVNQAAEQKRQRFTVGLYLSKDANSYLLKTKTADGTVLESSTAIRGEESFWQYTAGVTAGYAVHKHLIVQTGVFFSQKKKITATNSYVGFKEDTALNRNYANYQYNLNADYLEFTLKLKYYYAHTGRWSFYAAPGLCAGMNFPVRSDKSYFLREEYNQGTTRSDRILLEPFSMGLDLTGALGIERRVKQNWIVYAEPAYRYGLDPMIRHRSYDKIPVEHYLRAFGMGFGVLYSF